MPELLSPVGDFNCLKAAVQNGADSVYFGANLFSARAFATNFDLEELQKAIQYAKIRGVKTHLTLNTLIKDSEFENALFLAKRAYEFGIDAIIVQDLGLALKLIKLFPDLPIHASTQMTVHNLNGALELQKLGFKRVVLSRELSLNEIEYISKNADIEVECFIHGALCISYSGQCLFSSMLGGRSGNRGKCAGPCRLPFSLLENNRTINSGYLLSTRDLCALDFIPSLIKAGVKCFKIEGRMKSPEYAATVTRIYRKYIDLFLSNSEYIVEEQDRKDLMQIFNRGMASSGHLDNFPNPNLVFKEKPNHIGLFLGIVQKYNKNKGYITLKLNEHLSINDTISLEKEDNIYTVSELLDGNQNITVTEIGQTVTIGRMKGNINLGDKIYKMSSKALNHTAKESFQKETKKILLDCKVAIKNNSPISISVFSANSLDIYKGLNINCILDFVPLKAQNRPLDKQTVINQISKTASTPFKFRNIDVQLDDGLFLPKLSILNELRRLALEQVQNYVITNNTRIIDYDNTLNDLNDMKTKTSKNDDINCIGYLESENSKNINYIKNENSTSNSSNNEKYVKNEITKNVNNSNIKNISLLLNIINLNFDYSKLRNFSNLYIPLKYFTNKKYDMILDSLSKNFNLYIYMPTIIKSNYKNLFYNNVEDSIKKYDIKGFIISNICNIFLLDSLFKESKKKFEIISNYTFNVFNQNSILELKNMGVNKFTISPELDKNSISTLCNNCYLPSELIVYGKIPLLNMNYCLLGETDKCYPNCKQRCLSNNVYFLKDRLNMNFRILPDNIQTVTTVFNSKTLSILPSLFNTNNLRVDILDETIDEINNIFDTVISGKRFEGKDFTNGNLNREI